MRVEAKFIRKRLAVTLTRPNDTTTYSDGDAVTDSTLTPTALTFTDAMRYKGGRAVIEGTRLVLSANQATLPSLDLYLFSAEPTADADNAAFTPSDADMLNLLTIITYDSPIIGDATSGAGGNAVLVPANTPTDLLEAAAGSKDIYGLFVVRNGYAPVANETFTVILSVMQD